MNEKHIDIINKRANYSKARLGDLSARLKTLNELEGFPNLTIFGAGSYARHEASEYSDIDLFFMSVDKRDDLSEPRTHSMRLFGKIIEIIDDMHFPKFSNDCEYLVLLYTNEVLEQMGSRVDDHENFFTARMLLLLESQCLYGNKAYDIIIEKIIQSYFKDYPEHKETFQPLFLLNDICRFWKTLLLNYENKRNIPGGGAENIEKRKIRQKVRNFKLKYSRMTTCFATIASLGSHTPPVTTDQIIQMTQLTPLERIQSIIDRVPQTKSIINELLNQYGWFLEMTGLPTVALEERFSDTTKRTEMFQKASKYGDTMYNLIQTIDEANEKLKLLRNLMI